MGATVHDIDPYQTYEKYCGTAFVKRFHRRFSDAAQHLLSLGCYSRQGTALGRAKKGHSRQSEPLTHIV